jgi:hypothetical protein
MKKAYTAPVLKDVGSFEALTKANGNTNDLDYFCKLPGGGTESTTGSGPGTGSCL